MEEYSKFSEEIGQTPVIIPDRFFLKKNPGGNSGGIPGRIPGETSWETLDGKIY